MILVLTGVFLPTSRWDFVNWDDDFHVITNPKVQEPWSVGLRDWLTTPELGYPVPVTMASYALGRWLHGAASWGFHLVNGLLHLANTLWLWALVRRFAGRKGWALAAAAFFGLHPIVVEPVSWVSGRKDLLAAFFLLWALFWLLTLRARDDGRMGPRWGVAGLMLLSTLSKPVTALCPLVAWVLDRRGRRGPWPAVLGIHLGLVAMTFHLEGRVGALRGDSSDLGFLGRILTGAAWHGRNLLWPADLMPKYLDPPGGPSLAVLGAGLALVLGAVVLLVWAWRRCPEALPGLLLAAVTYGPVSGVVPLSRQYADSYLYLPLAGLAWSAVQAVGPRLSEGVLRRVRWVGVALAMVLAGASLRQTTVWKDGVSLWATVWHHYPDSPQVCRNLGNAHLFGRRHEPSKAVAVYRHCIDRLGQREFFLKNLAVATAMTGDVLAARPLVQEALHARPDDAALQRWALRLGIPLRGAHPLPTDREAVSPGEEPGP